MTNFSFFIKNNLRIFCLANTMETFGDKNLPKLSRKFYCNFCDYGTSKKSSFEEHLLTDKHKKQAFGDGLLTKFPAFLPFLPFLNFNCEKCSKQYQSRNGLWKHKKRCSENVEQMNDCEPELSDKELIKILIEKVKSATKFFKKCLVVTSYHPKTITLTTFRSSSSAARSIY